MSSGKYRKEHDCLNCGQHVEKHYCSNCGQPNLEIKENFWAFITHSVAHYFHFDNKFFQTLKPLLIQPGQVTLDYLAGKRARYINPVSMYIFVSIIYFLIVPHALEKEENHEAVVATKLSSSNKVTGKFDKNIDSNLAGVLPASAASQIKGAVNYQEFKALKPEVQQQYVDSLVKLNLSQKSDSLKEVIESYQESIADREELTSHSAYDARQRSLPADERDNWFQRYFKKKEISLNMKKAEGTFDLQAELKKYQPKQYFLLMPLLAFFIMLNFRKNHIYYLHHLIFTIHGMTAYFIISIVTQPLKKYVFGLDSWMSDVIGMLVSAGILWYLFTGLSVFYNRSRGQTIRKTIMVIILYAMSLSISKLILKEIITFILA
ncbi:MAG: DUF3667 domain-containing protein [Bacteroidota bacterium]